MKLLFFTMICLPLISFSQKKDEQKRLQTMADSIRFVKNVPHHCSDSIFENHSPGCGDHIFWNLVKEKKDIVSFLIDKLDDDTQSGAIVPQLGGSYAVADIAYAVMQEIIADIPTFSLMGIESDSSACEQCSYIAFLRADIGHRKDFQKAVRKWEQSLGGRWVESPKVLTCDCAFPHPNGGHYIRQFTRSNFSGNGIHLEYSYLQAHSIGIGYNFISESFFREIKSRSVNYTFDASLTGLFYNGISALGQRIDLGINVEKISPDFHLFFEHNDRSDFRVGAKIGMSFENFFYLHYRYAYPLGTYENPFISRHGIVLTFKLNEVPILGILSP